MMNTFLKIVFLIVITTCPNFALRNNKHYNNNGIDKDETFNLNVFEDQFGLGQNETLELTVGKCNNMPENWANRVGSLEPPQWRCIRLWNGRDCTGRTRCFCEHNFLSFNESFPIAQNTTWNQQLVSIETCGLEKGKAVGAIFSKANFTGEQTVIVLEHEECLTFYEGDKWRGKAVSGSMLGGSLCFFAEENCKGDGVKNDDILNFPDFNVISIKNCGSF